MKKLLLLLFMLILSISASSKGFKYHPKTKTALQELIENESIYLGDIDTSAITDMSYLFLRGAKIISLHTSGHADEKDFDKLIKKVEPKMIIPVHTENSEWFKKYEHCEIICDKNTIKI